MVHHLAEDDMLPQPWEVQLNKTLVGGTAHGYIKFSLGSKKRKATMHVKNGKCHMGNRQNNSHFSGNIFQPIANPTLTILIFWKDC